MPSVRNSNSASSLAELPNTYLTPQAMSCSAKAAPPVPWNCLTPSIPADARAAAPPAAPVDGM